MVCTSDGRAPDELGVIEPRPGRRHDQGLGTHRLPHVAPGHRTHRHRARRHLHACLLHSRQGYSPQYSLRVVLGVFLVTRARWAVVGLAVDETFHYVATWLYIRGSPHPRPESTRPTGSSSWRDLPSKAPWSSSCFTWRRRATAASAEVARRPQTCRRSMTRSSALRPAPRAVMRVRFHRSVAGA